MAFTKTILIAAFGLFMAIQSPMAKLDPDPLEVRRVARQAYEYGFALMDQYRQIYESSINTKSPSYRGPLNSIFTDRQDPQRISAAIDLRREPIVIGFPPFSDSSTFELKDLRQKTISQIHISKWDHPAQYVLIVGPKWQGHIPAGMTQVIRSPSELLSLSGRGQIVKDWHSRARPHYSIESLSSFSDAENTRRLQDEAWPLPLVLGERPSLEFIKHLTFLLELAPDEHAQAELQQAFSKFGLSKDRLQQLERLPQKTRDAFFEGLLEGQNLVNARQLASHESSNLGNVRK